jgi:2-keto-3-deoxy-6-phosphogluconate aldolase
LPRLFEAYRAFHEQGFVPIFVEDELDSRMLLDACAEAGVKGIEYTLRRRDAHQMIPWIREHLPGLFLLAGSAADDEAIVGQRRRHYPQLLTLRELDAMDVDGFVSMMTMSRESIARYAPTRVLMPCAMTSNEAFQQISAGAHFAKVIGPGLDLVRLCRAAPTFDYCPVVITGGMTCPRIPEAVEAGAVLIGSGFDLILRGETDVTPANVASRLRECIEVTAEARAAKWPAMARAVGATRQTWLDSLPHYHPF